MNKHFYLLRGLIREKEHWGPFIDELQKQYPESQISTIDIPGAGEYFQNICPLSISGIVEEMRKDFITLKSENEISHLVAISLGGMISVEWMRKYPHDFKLATLINTSFGGISPFYQRLLPSALLHLLKIPFFKGREREAKILELVSNHNHKNSPTLDLWESIHQRRPVSIDNSLRQLFAAANFKIKDFTPPIPVQILASEADRMVSVECSRAIAKKWNAPILEHKSAGHDLSLDDPLWVAQNLETGTSSQ